MAERLVAVAGAEGLHARPAALFVKAATAAGIPITIAKTASGARMAAPGGYATARAAAPQAAAGSPAASPQAAESSTIESSTIESSTAESSTAESPAADARSILAVLALDVRHGDEVVLRADGDGAEAALDRLASLLQDADV